MSRTKTYPTGYPPGQRSVATSREVFDSPELTRRAFWDAYWYDQDTRRRNANAVRQGAAIQARMRRQARWTAALTAIGVILVIAVAVTVIAGLDR